MFIFVYIIIYKKTYLSSIAIVEIRRIQKSQLKPEIRISSDMYHLYKAAKQHY